MSRRTVVKYLPACCVAVALVASVGQIATAFPGGDRMGAALDRAGTNSPRFSPARPANLDEFTTTPELRSVYFEYNKARIHPDAEAVLDRDAAWLKANPFHDIVIAAHADERGTAQYNFRLAERRARALRDELVSRGVPADRIVLASYGVGQPACSEKNEECWSQNRRADVMIRRLPQQVP